MVRVMRLKHKMIITQTRDKYPCSYIVFKVVCCCEQWDAEMLVAWGRREKIGHNTAKVLAGSRQTLWAKTFIRSLVLWRTFMPTSCACSTEQRRQDIGEVKTNSTKEQEILSAPGCALIGTISPSTPSPQPRKLYFWIWSIQTSCTELDQSGTASHWPLPDFHRPTVSAWDREALLWHGQGQRET